MNDIRLRGVLKNIQPSHEIQGVEFCKASLIVPRIDGKEDIVNIRFKRFTNPYEEDQIISVAGNLRSYSSKLDTGKNKVDLYVFTYFDLPDLADNDAEYYNYANIDGRVCKIDEIRYLSNGCKNIHFILANNLIVSDGQKKLNSYIPCIAWGKCAEELKDIKVNTPINLFGTIHSREYKKTLPDGSFEIRVAHEFVIEKFELL